MENEDFMLTTFDNPINPFQDFIAWWKHDLLLGHDCCGLLARNAGTSEVFSDEKNNQLTIQAMKDIVSSEPMIYKMVKKEDFEEKKKENN